jgi:CRISPR-associated protein Cmr2
MDGDNMGILLSGVKSEKEHEDISEALSNFSRETALDLVEKQYPARLVYAGGDDVLAFAPLARDKSEAGQPRHVLDLVDMLQTKYREKVIDALPKQQNEERVEGVSASIGIVIAHHFTSLSYVLRSGREAESAAKKHYGKDALVVTVIRRSGEQTRVGCHWRYDGLTDDGQPIKLFSKFYTLFKSDILSPKCVYILLEEVPALVGQQEYVWESEIRRVLLRQYDKEKDDQSKEKAVDIPTLAKHLAKLAGAMDNDVNKRYITDKKPEMAVELHSDKTRYGIVETLGWLLVMAFLARKEQE